MPVAKVKYVDQKKCNTSSLRRGFSLVEIIAVIALVSIIGVVVVTFLVSSLKSYRVKKQSVEQQEKVAHVMVDFEREVRAATRISSANQNEFRFYRFFDLTSPDPTQVRYFMSGDNFKIGLTEPVGVSPNVTYPVENEVIDLVVENVQNVSTLFTYYDGGGTLLSSLIDPAVVRMVGLTISLDNDINSPPSAISETTKVNLRNMKSNL